MLLPGEQLPACSRAIRAEAVGTSLGTEIGDVIAAILVSRFSGRPLAKIWPVLGTFQAAHNQAE